jgi:hypothetical protein
MLVQLATAAGTFYQVCEALEFDIENDKVEKVCRAHFDDLVDAGHAYLVGPTYHITSAARAAIAPPAPYVGQVAGPAYRGTPAPAPVRIARRAAGAGA